MDIITTWQAKTEQEQTALLLTNIKKAMREQIPASQRTMYEPHEFLGAAWERTNERFTTQYLNGTNDERTENGKEPITMITLVYRCCKDAVRSMVSDERKHDHDTLESEGENTGGGYHSNTWQTNKRRTTEDRAIAYMFWEDFTKSRDQIDRLIIEGLRDGYKQNECATAAQMTPPAINKRVQRLRMAVAAAIA